MLTTLWILAKLLKSYPGIFVFQLLTVPKHMALLKEAVRRIKEGTSVVLLQSGLEGKWWADSMDCCCHLRNV